MTDIISGLPAPLIMGLLLGGLYVLIAQGLSLVFGVMKIINIAHGDFVIFAAYFGYAALTVFGIDPIISLLVGIPIWFVAGYFIQKYLFSRAFELSLHSPLIIAFGLSLIFQNLAQLIWSPMSRGLSTSYSLASASILGQSIPLAYVLDFLAALIIMIALRLFLKKTYLGKAISASSQDKRGAELMGINTGRVYAYAFAIAMMTAAIAGVFLGLTFPFTPTSGVSFLIIALGVIIIGGLGSMIGTFIGGMILGLAQTIGGYIAGAATQMLFAYLIVLIVLAVRPQGILGRK